MTLNEQTEIAGIGAGRFGTFWARHLSRYHRVSVYDRSRIQKKQIDTFAQWASLKICLQKPYIFLTIPIHQIKSFLKKHRNLFQENTVIIDCASVKEPVLQWFEQELPGEIFYIASHPLFGPDSAMSGLKDHILTLIPGRVPYNRYNFLVNFFRSDMELNVINISAADHDLLMAYNLSLIHHLGRTFAAMRISRIPLMMDSLGKLNAIARVVMNDSEELFRDFYKYNRYSRQIRDKFLTEFNKVVSRKDVSKP